jgi:hypothetical protein
MPAIQLPNQIFNISSVSYADVTVTATSTSSLSNLYAGLTGNIVGPAGIPVSKTFIISDIVSTGIIRLKAISFEGSGQQGTNFDFSTYNGGKIYLEAQVANVSDNSGLATASTPGQMPSDLYSLCLNLETDYNAGKRMVADSVVSAALGAIPATQKGAASGVATLDTNTLIPTTQLPASSATASGSMSADHYSLCAALKTPYDAGDRLITVARSTAVDNLITYGDYLSTANVPAFSAGAASIAPGTDKASRYLIASTVTLDVPCTLTIATTNTPLQGNYIVICRALALGQVLSVSNGGTAGGTLGTFPASMTVPRGLMVWYDGTNFIFNGYCWIRA